MLAGVSEVALVITTQAACQAAAPDEPQRWLPDYRVRDGVTPPAQCLAPPPPQSPPPLHPPRSPLGEALGASQTHTSWGEGGRGWGQ